MHGGGGASFFFLVLVISADARSLALHDSFFLLLFFRVLQGDQVLGIFVRSLTAVEREGKIYYWQSGNSDALGGKKSVTALSGASTLSRSGRL